MYTKINKKPPSGNIDDGFYYIKMFFYNYFTTMRVV